MLFGFFTFWIICSIVAAIVAGKKNRSGGGWFAAAFFLTPLALLILLALPAVPLSDSQLANSDLRKCPFCAEEIKAEAIVCKHCGKDVPRIITEKTPDTVNLSRCPACSAPIGRDAFFCKCGAGLK